MIQMEDSSESEITRLKEGITGLTGDKKTQIMKIRSQNEQSRPIINEREPATVKPAIVDTLK